MRDDILHYGVQYNPVTGKLVWDNLRSAHKPGKLSTFEVSLEMMNDLANDVGQIVLGLMYELTKETMPKEAHSWFQEHLRSTWKYKPPQQAAQKRTGDSDPQLKQRQPDASRPKRSAKPERKSKT